MHFALPPNNTPDLSIFHAYVSDGSPGLTEHLYTRIHRYTDTNGVNCIPMHTQILSLIIKIIVYVRDAVINIRLTVHPRRVSAGAYRERFASSHTFLFSLITPPPPPYETMERKRGISVTLRVASYRCFERYFTRLFKLRLSKFKTIVFFMITVFLDISTKTFYRIFFKRIPMDTRYLHMKCQSSPGRIVLYVCGSRNENQ